MAEEKNETLKKARSEMTYLTGDEEIKRMQWLEEKWEMDRASEVGYAKEEGIKEGIEKVVKGMLKENIDIETICKVTNLTKKEVEKIKCK